MVLYLWPGSPSMRFLTASEFLCLRIDAFFIFCGWRGQRGAQRREDEKHEAVTAPSESVRTCRDVNEQREVIDCRRWSYRCFVIDTWQANKRVRPQRTIYAAPIVPEKQDSPYRVHKSFHHEQCRSHPRVSIE